MPYSPNQQPETKDHCILRYTADHHHVPLMTSFSDKMRHLMKKATKWSVYPAKTQTSLGIRPVWSEFLLSTWRGFGSLATHWVHSEDSDQTGRMPRLIWVFAGRTVILSLLSWGGSNTDHLHCFVDISRFNWYKSRSTTKPTKWPVRPAKTQISLGIHPVWSESSLCAQ